jgi:hypothetical protein
MNFVELESSRFCCFVTQKREFSRMIPSTIRSVQWEMMIWMIAILMISQNYGSFESWFIQGNRRLLAMSLVHAHIFTFLIGFSQLK